MKPKAGGSASSNIAPVPVGTYPGRLVAAIDVGIQPRPKFNGEEKPPIHQVALTYELLDEFLKDEEGEDIPDKPRWVTEIMPFYGPGATKSTIAKRYAALDPTSEHDGDLGRLLGVPVMVTIVHNPKKGGDGVWVNVESIAAMRAKDAEKAPALVNPSILFDMDAPDPAAFEKVPNWLKKMITSALNFKGSKTEALVNAAPPKDDVETPKASQENPY
jgi:hypothetical protein